MSDCVSLAAYAPLISLRGNNDLFDRVPDETVLDWEGVRLFACHGHRYGVKGGLDRLCRAAKDRNASVALFGHTHLPCNRFMDGVLLCNPGSVGYAGRERESYGELRLAAGQAEFRLRYVQGEAKRSDYSPGLHL